MNKMRAGTWVGIVLSSLAMYGEPLAQTGKTVSLDVVVKKGPGGGDVLVCTAGGRTCDPKQLQLLAAEASKRGVTVSLSGPDGSLKCTSRGGKECNEDHYAIVRSAGKAVRTAAIVPGL